MSRAILVLSSNDIRSRAKQWVDKAPFGTRVEYKAPKRSIPQNDRLWLMLTAVSKTDWHGQKYSPDEWKDYFMHAYRGEKWMPAEDGGMVPIGRSTSDLSKHEFGELMELIVAFCVRQNIELPWDKPESVT